MHVAHQVLHYFVGLFKFDLLRFRTQGLFGLQKMLKGRPPQTNPFLQKLDSEQLLGEMCEDKLSFRGFFQKLQPADWRLRIFTRLVPGVKSGSNNIWLCLHFLRWEALA